MKTYRMKPTLANLSGEMIEHTECSQIPHRYTQKCGILLFTMRDLRFSSGLFLIVLSIPFFSFSGDLRLECIINENSNCNLYKNIQIASLALMTVGMLLAILSRPGGTGIKALDLYDEEKAFDSIVAEFEDTPSFDAVGVVQQGYEWVEHPPGSDTWFTRPESGGAWTKYRG